MSKKKTTPERAASKHQDQSTIVAVPKHRVLAALEQAGMDSASKAEALKQLEDTPCVWLNMDEGSRIADAAWFAARPSRSIMLRPASAQEKWDFHLELPTLQYMVVAQIRPGVRKKFPLVATDPATGAALTIHPGHPLLTDTEGRLADTAEAVLRTVLSNPGKMFTNHETMKIVAAMVAAPEGLQ